MLSIFETWINSITKFFKAWPMAIFSTLAFIFIILRLYLPIEPLLLMLFIVGILLIVLNVKGKISRFLTCFFIFAMLFGIFAGNNGIYRNEKLVNRFDGEYVRIDGEVSSLPTENDRGQNFFFDVNNIYSNKGKYSKNFKIYVKNTTGNNVKYGEKLAFNCTIDGNDSVNSYLSAYYMAKGAPLAARNLTIISRNDNDSNHKILTDARKYVLSLGDKYFTGDTAELFKALVAGDKSGFSEELTLSLTKSGLSHLACVSGLHVSILGMAVHNLLRRRNRILSAIISLIIVYAFAFITGASPSMLRAAIMFTSFLIAKVAIHENHSFTSLSFSAMFLAVLNPFVIFDYGFILSFLSVLGIEVFAKYFKGLLRFLPKSFADSMSVTVSAQLMTFPVVVNMFGYTSAYSIFSNVIISAFFNLVLYFCFALIPLSFIPYVNSICAMVCRLLLDCVISVSMVFSDIPNSVIYANFFDIPEMICYYTIVLLFVCRKRISMWFMGAVVLMCSALLLISPHISSNVTTYGLADNSYVYIKENCTILEANDNLSDIARDLQQWGRDTQVDYLIVNIKTDNQLSGLIDISNLVNVKKVYVSDKNALGMFEIIAARGGMKVQFFEDGTSDKLIKSLKTAEF